MPESLRVAMVAACPFPYPRGTPIRIQRLAEALAQRGHEIHLVTYHLGNELPEPVFTIHRIPRIPTYRKESPGPSYQKLLVLDPLLTFKLRRVLREFEFDVIHAHHAEGLLTAMAARGGGRAIPLVFDVHTLLETELPYYRLGLPRRLKSWVGRSFDRYLPRQADAVIAVTEEIKSRLVEHHAVAAEKIEVIASGVESDLFPTAGLPRPASTDSARTLVYAGNLAAYQGIELLLEAFAKVVSTRSDVRLLLVTDTPLTPYEPLADRLGVRQHIRVKSADFSQLREQLPLADIALSPRVDCDGYAQKLLNYMAAGVPVVSFAGSARGLAHRELVWVVPDRDIDAFAAGIVLLLDEPDLARRLGERGRHYVQSERSWKGAAEETERVYRNLLRSGG